MSEVTWAVISPNLAGSQMDHTMYMLLKVPTFHIQVQIRSFSVKLLTEVPGSIGFNFPEALLLLSAGPVLLPQPFSLFPGAAGHTLLSKRRYGMCVVTRMWDGHHSPWR